MVQVRKNPIHEITTKDGEVKILLEITINVNSNSDPTIEVSPKVQKQEPEPEESRWAIPSFKTEKIKFGKKVED